MCNVIRTFTLCVSPTPSITARTQEPLSLYKLVLRQLQHGRRHNPYYKLQIDIEV